LFTEEFSKSENYTPYSSHPWTDAGRSPIFLPVLPLSKNHSAMMYTIIALYKKAWPSGGEGWTITGGYAIAEILLG
jgi:hypothetical protein